MSCVGWVGCLVQSSYVRSRLFLEEKAVGLSLCFSHTPHAMFPVLKIPGEDHGSEGRYHQAPRACAVGR